MTDNDMARPDGPGCEPSASTACGVLAESHPSREERIDTALRVMRLFDGFDGPDCDQVWWRTDDEYAPVTMLVNCNDLFFWGCADCERVTPDSIGALEATVAEVVAIDKNAAHDAPLLWIARHRRMRPQGAYYKYLTPALHALFDACGEPRDAGLSNPVARDSDARRMAETGTGSERSSGSAGRKASPEPDRLSPTNAQDKNNVHR